MEPLKYVEQWNLVVLCSYLGSKPVHEEPTREVSDEGAGAGAVPAEALQVRRQLPHLDAVSRNTRIDRDIRDR